MMSSSEGEGGHGKADIGGCMNFVLQISSKCGQGGSESKNTQNFANFINGCFLKVMVCYEPMSTRSPQLVFTCSNSIYKNLVKCCLGQLRRWQILKRKRTEKDEREKEGKWDTRPAASELWPTKLVSKLRNTCKHRSSAGNFKLNPRLEAEEYRISATKTKLKHLFLVYRFQKNILEPWRLISLFHYIKYLGQYTKISSNLGCNSWATNVYKNCKACQPLVTEWPMAMGAAATRVKRGTGETRRARRGYSLAARRQSPLISCTPTEAETDSLTWYTLLRRTNPNPMPMNYRNL